MLKKLHETYIKHFFDHFGVYQDARKLTIFDKLVQLQENWHLKESIEFSNSFLILA